MAVKGYGTNIYPYIGDARQPIALPGMLWNPDRSAVSTYTNSIGATDQVTTITCSALTDGQVATASFRVLDTSDVVFNFNYTSVGATTANALAAELLKRIRAKYALQSIVKSSVNGAVVTLTSKTAFAVSALTANLVAANTSSITAPDVIGYGVPVFSAAPSANNPRGVEVVNRALVATDQVRGITIRRSRGVLVRNAYGQWVDGYDYQQPVSVAERAKISVQCAEDCGATSDVFVFFTGISKGLFSGTAGANKTQLPANMFRWAGMQKAGEFGWLLVG